MKGILSLIGSCRINHQAYLINLDETSVRRDAPSDTTIDTVGVEQVRIRTTGSEKTAYTVVLAATFTGEKLPLMFIWPSQGKRNVQGPLPDNVYLEHREISWMDTGMMLKWIKKILCKRTRKIAPGKKGLLLLDGFAAHLSKEVTETIKAANFEPMVLPPDFTAFLQPIDISVNRSFKSHYRQR